MTSLASEQIRFGYLSALQSAEHGCFGGYLIISPLGRPLEFHCSAPVRPTRAQEILYGPTLEPYMFGEQIRSSLLNAATIAPQLILTDHPAAIGESLPVGPPLILARSVLDASDSKSNEIRLFSGVANNPVCEPGQHLLRSWSEPLSAFDCEIRLPRCFDGEPSKILEWLTLLAERVELLEPFGRIHEAICEAQRIGQQGCELHEHAA